MNIDKIEEIHSSLVNGQRKQMVKQIDKYGNCDFWDDYKKFLYHGYATAAQLDYFTDVTISYFRIKSN